MTRSSSDPGDPVAHVEVLKKDLKYKDKEVERLKQELGETCKRLQERDARLEEVLEAMNKLVVDLAVRDQEIAQIRKRDLEASKKKSSTRIQNFCALVLSVLATLVVSFGVNMVTSNPPDMKGYVLIVFGGVGAIAAGCISLFIAS